jgi:N-acetyltransferase
MPNPDLQPTLTGERVLIRPIQPSDWYEMFRVASDPLIWELHPARDRYTEPAFRQYFDGAIASGSAFTFIDRATGRIIGSSRYNAFDPAADEVEIGWTFLARDFWGGSYNAEIKRLMLDYAFTFAGVVIFWVGEHNYRSQRAMEKIGGVRRPGLFTRAAGGDVPHVIFEIRRPV